MAFIEKHGCTDPPKFSGSKCCFHQSLIKRYIVSFIKETNLQFVLFWMKSNFAAVRYAANLISSRPSSSVKSNQGKFRQKWIPKVWITLNSLSHKVFARDSFKINIVVNTNVQLQCTRQYIL